MVDTFHEHQFSVGPLCVSLILKGSTQLLDGDVPLQVVVVCRTGEGNSERRKSVGTPKTTGIFGLFAGEPAVVRSMKDDKITRGNFNEHVHRKSIQFVQKE